MQHSVPAGSGRTTPALGKSIRDLPVSASLHTAVPFIATAALLGAALLTGGDRENVALIMLIVASPAVAWLRLPGDSVRRASSSQFLLVCIAAGLHGLPAAAGVGILGFLLEGAPGRRAGGTRELKRVGLFSGIASVAFAMAASIDPALDSFAILLWMAFAALWLLRRDSGRQALGIRIAVFGWLAIMLLMPVWSAWLPDSTSAYRTAGEPALRFALWFMTIDTALVSLIGLGTLGRAGIRFWQREFLPTFARYSTMAVAAAVGVALFAIAGLFGLVSGLLAFGMASLILRDREMADRKRIATICALSSALDARDPYTKGHSDRVAAYSVAIASRLGWSDKARRELEVAAHLHDVGKIGVPDAILLAPGRLSEEQFAVIRGHAELSAGIVRNVPDFRAVSSIVLQHHERLDGSGYPRGLKAAEIHPAARILGVADSFDAMTSNRPYRSAMSSEQAIEELCRSAGRHYDPDVVDALAELSRTEELDAALRFGYCLTH